jgi:uncharacterized protein YecE (DUF72 family)
MIIVKYSSARRDGPIPKVRALGKAFSTPLARLSSWNSIAGFSTRWRSTALFTGPLIPADVDTFRSSIEPLAKNGKLGVLLAQFPPSFKNDDYGRRIIGAVAKTFGEYPLAVELRHRSWSDDENIAALLRENKMAWVQIDEPKFSTSVAREVPLTGDIAYFRFHGRNAKDWWSGNSEQRYRYHYSPEEIEELVGRVKAAAEKSRMLFAYFNNHWQAYAPRNANDLKKALQLPFQEIQMTMDLENAMDIDDTEREKNGGKRGTV